MKLGYTICYVSDVEATISFYERAFGFARKLITPERDYGELETGETVLAFASYDLAKSNFSEEVERSGLDRRPFAMELVLVTNQIEKDFQKAIDCEQRNTNQSLKSLGDRGSVT